MAIPFPHELLAALNKIDRPVAFCTSGRLPDTHPGLEIAGLGPIALPLEKRQALAIKKRASHAPFGKGTRTLVDRNVRRVRQLDADQVSFTNPAWEGVVTDALRTVRSDLGLEKQKLEARLYKLLLYETGDFFLPHRDGEKLDRMVATLVITLPSRHDGGELVVRHDGQEHVIDFAAASRFQSQFACFYADCEHEIRPVRNGFRLALVYNVTLARSKKAIPAPKGSQSVAAVAGILRKWGQDAEKADPAKLAVLLDHKYSPAGLAYGTLKGHDRARADVLFAAARQTGCDASLCLVTHWVSGSAEDDYASGRYGRRRGYDDDYADDEDGEHVMGEVFDHSLTARRFSDAEGHSLHYGRIPLEETEIVSRTPLSEGKPDKEEYEGYTGNEGMTLERWYHRAAVMVWPGESRFDVLCEAGMTAAVGGLARMMKFAERGNERCLEFARRIIDYWPESEFSNPQTRRLNRSDEFDFDDDEDAEFDDAEECDDEPEIPQRDDQDDIGPSQASFLSLLAVLGDVPLISRAILEVLTKDATLDPGADLLVICRGFGWLTFESELAGLFDRGSAETLERDARMLVDWSLLRDKSADRTHLCRILAGRLVAALERWASLKDKWDWRARKVNCVKLLPLFVQASVALESDELIDQLTEVILKNPNRFNVTSVQVPALEQVEGWLKRNLKRSCGPLQRWLSALLLELTTLASHEPQQPKDGRRDSDTGCTCRDCQELGRFLADPNRTSFRLALAKQRRQHLHDVIDQRRLDTSHVTERKGSPFTLVFTKNMASFERARDAFHLVLEQLAKVRELCEWLNDLQERAATGVAAVAPSKRRARRQQ